MMTELDFHILDDLALAAQRGRGGLQSFGSAMVTSRIGPLGELVLLERTGCMELPAIRTLPPSFQRSRLIDALSTDRPSFSVGQELHLGFIRTLRNPRNDVDVQWINFCRRAQQAAEASGLSKRISQGLVGAIGELEDNIHLHSERSSTGFIGYRAVAGEFEFLIADSGIGALSSLKQCSAYSLIKDAGTALRIALTDGESRFGPDTGHGIGFQSLFTGLANLNGFLRFRSDDHGLVIDGQNPNLISAKLLQCAYLDGFLASIVCRIQ